MATGGVRRRAPRPDGADPFQAQVMPTRRSIAAFEAIVRQRVRAYLKSRAIRGTAMPETASAATSVFSRPLMLVSATLGALLAGTVALWAHYGTAVFYETILAGLAACL